MSTQQLVQAILEKSPTSDPETILEVLVSCNGNIDQALKLLGVTSASRQRQSTLTGFRVGKKGRPGSKALESAAQGLQKLPARSQRPIIDLFTPDQVQSAGIDCVLIEDVLEPTLANSLLMELMDQSKTWSKQEFILFDRQVTSPHLSAIHTSSPDGKSVSYQGRIIDAIPFTNNLSIARSKVQDLVCEVLEVGSPGSSSAVTGERNVQETALDSSSKPSAFYPETSRPWHSDFVVSNRYDGPNSGVGFHSDQLTHLGPKPIIAGLSLGVSREFRLKRRSEKRGSSQYSIHCSHNSLVIMLPGCQERWKHSIPLVKAVGSHALTGSTRISLTFRMYPDKFKLENLPKCKCNKAMILRTTTQENYKYIWQCGQSYVSKDACGMVTDADL